MGIYSSGPTDRGPAKTKNRTRARAGRGGMEKTLLDWIDPRGDVSAYTEGRENWEGGETSLAENKRRKVLVEEYKKEDVARSKIKPIKDPEGDKTSARRKAAKRKKKGRAGTLLSQGRETLG